MARVALVECSTYDLASVRSAVQKGITLLGGAGTFAKAGEKILLKPNLLSGDPPEKCVTTHPSVFRAVAEVLQTAGALLCYGDSPAVGNILKVARKTGIKDVADALDIPLADFKTGKEVFFEAGIQNRKFVIARSILDSDGVVSLPKLKTHGLERLTACVKNQFGCIPGVLKGEYHVKLPDAGDFAKMLVDLNRFVRPRLYVVDGVWAMEGNGPRGGTPRKMNILLFSDDPVAVDATICRMINLIPEYVPTVKYGQEFGLGTCLDKDIQLLGDDPAQFKASGFQVERSRARLYRGRLAARLINEHMVPKPYIREKKCVQCGMCVAMCPARPKAVDWFDGDKAKPPAYNYQMCIRCYCCQEICPESAIELKVPALRRLMRLLTPLNLV